MPPQQTVPYAPEAWVIEVPGLDSPVEFPGTMSEAAVTQAVKQLHADAAMSKTFGYPIRQNRFRDFTRSLQEHPVKTGLTTAIQLAAPGLLGKAAMRAGPMLGRAVTGATEALQNPLVSGAIGAIPGTWRGNTSEALLGGLVGAAGGGTVSRAVGRLVAGRPAPALNSSVHASRYIPSTPPQRGPSAAQPRPSPFPTTSSPVNTPRSSRSPTEGIEVERLFQRLTRKPILTPAEQAQYEALKQMVGNRASDVGLGYASGGRRGLPK